MRWGGVQPITGKPSAGVAPGHPVIVLPFYMSQPSSSKTVEAFLGALLTVTGG